jgi:hypothetical protein
MKVIHTDLGIWKRRALGQPGSIQERQIFSHKEIRFHMAQASCFFKLLSIREILGAVSVDK